MQKSFFHHYYLMQLLQQQKLKSTYLAHPQGDMKLKVVVKIFDEECMLPSHEYAKSLTAMKGFLALDHPHIVPVLDIGIEHRQPYIVTQHMSHGSLRQSLESLAPKLMHWTTALNIVIQIAQALMYAHERHKIHGNIKPSNIFFDAVGDVLLADFRPSHFVDISKLSYKTDLQTISYMAPEQFMGRSTPSSDQYALAGLAYELLTGHTPFSDAQNFSLLWQKHAMVLPPPPTNYVPELLVAIEKAILKALSKNPEMRYPDIAAFAHALESELPASTVRKGRAIILSSESELSRPFPPSPQSELELEFPRSFPPAQDTPNSQLPALTDSMILPAQDTPSIQLPVLTDSMLLPVTGNITAEEKQTSSLSKALVAQENAHPGGKDTKQQAFVVPSPSDESLQGTHDTQNTQKKNLAALDVSSAPVRKKRFRPSKRFVLQACALVTMVLLSIGLLLFNNFSVDIPTGLPIGRVTTTPSSNATAKASTIPGTAIGTGTGSTNPGGNGGKGGTNGNGGNGGGKGGKGGGGGKGGKGGGGGGNGGSGNTPTPTTNPTPVVSVTSTTPTPTPTPAPTATPGRSLDVALFASVSASSSFEGHGWSKAFVNDNRTTSTPRSMGWSSNNDVYANHTEWISFDFGSIISVGRVDLFPRADPGNIGAAFPVNFIIMISADGINWSTVVTETNYPRPTSTENQVFFFPAQNAQYLIVEGTSLGQVATEHFRYRMQFSEVAIY